jgi:hypothetical protein
MNIRAAAMAVAITATGALAILALPLLATPGLLAWSGKPWFIPAMVFLNAFSVLAACLASKRERKPNRSSKRTREKLRAA